MSRLSIPGRATPALRRGVTTIQLTDEQRLAITELQLKRMRDGKQKPSLLQVVSEGLEMLLVAEKVQL